MKIVGEDGTALGANQRGEICAKGPQVCLNFRIIYIIHYKRKVSVKRSKMDIYLYFIINVCNVRTIL